MNQILLREHRQLISRWHTSRKFYELQYPLISAQKTPLIGNEFRVKESIEEWEKKPSLINTIDLYVRLTQSNLTETKEFIAVDRIIEENRESLSPIFSKSLEPRARFADKNRTYSTNKREVVSIIKRLKLQVNRHPKDALTWIDLAFYYSVLGQLEKADRCARTAYGLSPAHPFIANAFSRFLLHIDKPEEAYYVLRKTGLVKRDPVISSAALAISAKFDIGKPDIRSARRLIETHTGHPTLVSDLAASVGTIEFLNGATRKGKQHMSSALKNPTENSAAQGAWIAYKFGINLDVDPFQMISRTEAAATEYYVGGKFKECVSSLVDLYSFQPFSDAPLLDAGYISLVALDDPQFIIDASENRVPKTEMSFGELNNLVVAKVYTGKVDSVMSDFSSLKRKLDMSSPRDIGTFFATAGMMSFHYGDIETGKRLYQKSMSVLRQAKDYRGLSIAGTFFSEQLKLCNDPGFAQVHDEAEKLARKNRAPELEHRLKMIKKDETRLKFEGPITSRAAGARLEQEVSSLETIRDKTLYSEGLISPLLPEHKGS